MKLPFKNESFDFVVSILAIPFYINSLPEFKTIIEEIERVLKENGEARLWPLSKAEGPDHVSWPKEELNKIFEESGLTIEIRNPEAGFGKDGVLGADAILILKKLAAKSDP